MKFWHPLSQNISNILYHCIFVSSLDSQASMKLLVVSALEGSKVAATHDECLGTYEHSQFYEHYPIWKLTTLSGKTCSIVYHNDIWWVKKKTYRDEWVFKSSTMKGNYVLPSSPLLTWAYQSSSSSVYNEIEVTRPNFFASKCYCLSLSMICFI